MQQIDKVKCISRRLVADERGWFLKAITGLEDGIQDGVGEVYLTMGRPGQAKGGHYHPEALEWFTLIKGRATLRLEDVDTHAKKNIEMSFDNAMTVFIPNNVAHSVENTGNEDFILLAYTNKQYDPKDTIAYDGADND